ncbi:MAG: hypothetical protein HZA02_05255 [Nitrospinae bacterium]|nr:hypothetical protein [Nitrospinota bacterium]
MVERIKDAKSLDSPSAVKSPKSAKSKRHDPYGDLKKKIATLVKKHKDHSPSEIRKMITPHVLQECHLQDNPPAEKTLMGWIREVRKAEGLSSRPGRPKKK